MKKKNLFPILVGLMGSALGAQLLWTNHETPKINISHYKNSKKTESFLSKQIHSIPEVKLNAHNLKAASTYTPIATIIIGTINQNYFGYGWNMSPTGAIDTDFATLWKMIYPNANGNFNNPGTIATASQLATALDNYKTGGGDASALLAESFGFDWAANEIPPDGNYPLTSLITGCAFELNMQTNLNNLQNDATSLYTLVDDNYFGYSLTNSTDPLFSVLFGTDPTNPNVQTQAQITTYLKNQGPNERTFISTYLKNPSVEATNLNDLVDGWLKTDLTSQNTNLNIDATSLYNLVIASYYGYDLESKTNPLYSVVFTKTTNGETPATEASILNNLKTHKGSTFSILKQNLKTPGTATTDLNDLVDGSWLKTELTAQTTSLGYDIDTIYSLLINNYFGYTWGRIDQLDGWFRVLFASGSVENPGATIRTKEEFKKRILQTANRNVYWDWFRNELKKPGQLIENPTITDLDDTGYLVQHFQNQANDLTTDATSLFNLVSQNYFGYSFTDTTNSLFPIILGSDQTNPTVQTQAQIITNLKTSYNTSVFNLLTTYLKTPGTATADLNDLVDGSWLKTNLNDQNTKLNNDATTLFHLVDENYFGYSLTNTTDTLFPIILGSNQAKPTIQTENKIYTGLKAKAGGVRNFLATYLKTPGTSIPTPDLTSLKSGSWLATELTNQNSKLGIDATSLFNLVSQNYFGYSLDNTNDSLYSIIFGINISNPVVQIQAQIINNLKSWKGSVFNLLTTYLKTPGTATADLNDLVDGSWLKTNLADQNTKLNNDATTLFHLVSQNYFGYSLDNTNDSLYSIIFGINISNPVVQTQAQIITNLKTKKAGVVTLLMTYLNAPGTAGTNNPNDLTKKSWLKTNLINQKTSLINSLTTSVTKFYDVFKASFSGKHFNSDSFNDAEYILLFFNNNDNTLSLGTSPSEVANTFANNLITKLKENPNFQFPTSANKQLGAVQANSIDIWINTLFADNNGSITLTGDLANFANFQKTNVHPEPTSTKSNLALILGITIPLSLITLGVGGYFMWKKVIQPKRVKNDK